MKLTATTKTKKIWTAPVIHKIDLNAAKHGTNTSNDSPTGGGHTGS
jgi:hypothetical protein